jgi:hypothetical protein
MCGYGADPGQVYCENDGTKCCQAFVDAGSTLRLTYICIPEADTCAALTQCSGRDGYDSVFVCPPQHICLDDGRGGGGCTPDCSPPYEPCGAVCCTESATCTQPPGVPANPAECLPCNDGGTGTCSRNLDGGG